MVITTAGLELLQDLILEGGTPLTFSGVGVGDGLLEDSNITARTSLVHEVHRLPIEKIEKQEGGHIRVFARLATDIITTDFYHRELGVFTRHGEQEILFAYGNAGDDYDFIPATGNNASICKTIVTEFTVGSMKAVFLPLDSKDFVTHEAMNAQVEEVITRETRKVLEAIPQVDAAGNMTLGGTITVTAGIINGQLVVNNPSGSIGNGTHNQIHGTTWFYDGVEFRNGVIIRGNTFLESGVLNISKAASINCNGPATYGATINANGGINIPLAVGAATDTTATSRAYALGMAHTVMMHQTRTYWLASSCTATNGVTINHVVPGCYCEARLAANEHTSLTMRTTGIVGGGNYSKILGYSLPVRNSGDTPGAWFKASMLIGAGGQWEECPDGDMDTFRFRPVSGSAPAIARLVEVTLYYDAGYKARVRELIGIGNPSQYVVRTTTSAINYDGNTGLSAGCYRLVIAQSALSYSDALAAGVWLIIGGAADDTVLKLADIRGWDTYHVSSAPTLYLDAQAPSYGGYIQMESPTIINGIGSNTYVRYGLEPYQRSWITNVTEEPYTEDQSAE